MANQARWYNWLIYRLINPQLKLRLEQYARGRLLDIGCGVQPYREMAGPFIDEYVGLDHEETVHDSGAEQLVGTAYSIPAADESFDTTLCTDVLEHLEDPMAAVGETTRVLKPGGHFYHCDMLRPANKIVESGYYFYLRFCLNFTALLFGSSTSAHGCKEYFINALRMFYSADEFSDLLRDVGFEEVLSQTMLGGTIGYHRSMKPLDR